MAQNDLLKRYLDAGMALTQLTQQRAEAIVKNVVAGGELSREQTQAMVEDLMDRSRRNTEKLLDTVRKEVRSQLQSRGFATKTELARLEAKVDKLAKSSGGGSTTKKATKKKAAKKKTATKKKAAKKRSAKK